VSLEAREVAGCEEGRERESWAKLLIATIFANYKICERMSDLVAAITGDGMM
jgi:hypothetical protein